MKTSNEDVVLAVIGWGSDMPDEAVAFIQRRFDTEMTKQQFSTYKSQVKTKDQEATAAPSPAKKPAASPPVSSHGGLGGHVEAIKKAVEELGGDQVRKLTGLFE